MMNPLSPHPHPKTYTRYDGAGRRDLKLVISSLVIGLCVGAAGLYLGHSLPLARQLTASNSALTALKAASDLCAKENALSDETLETALHHLTICQADLQVARRASAAQAPIPASPIAPSAPSEEPAQLPVLPKPPPGRTTDAAPELTPAPPPVEIVAAPTPANWPPKPLPRPTHGVPAPEDDEGTVDARIPPSTTAAAPLAPLASSGAGRVNVGQEITLGGNLRVRLIAVSQRTSGKYCVIAGEGIDPDRIASGTSKRITRGGQTITLSARVEDGDTCRLSVSSR